MSFRKLIHRLHVLTENIYITFTEGGPLIILASRKIFNNALSAAIYSFIDMVLSKNKVINVRCKNGTSLIIERRIYGMLIRGFYKGFIKDVECHGNYLIINGMKLFPKILFKNGYYYLNTMIKFKNLYKSIIENFYAQFYSFINPKERIVVDVGAFVGDSAIYFVLRGARRVYAIEPHPGAYQEMLENIKLNNMQDKIIPINAALGSRPGIVKISNVDVEATAGMYHGLTGNGVIEVPMITLEQLISDYGVEPDVLKMDCEGCEYDIVLNDYEHVRLFRELIMEYHEVNGHKLSELLTLLNHDYKCRVINEKPGLGILHCMKI